MTIAVYRGQQNNNSNQNLHEMGLLTDTGLTLKHQKADDKIYDCKISWIL